MTALCPLSKTVYIFRTLYGLRTVSLIAGQTDNTTDKLVIENILSNGMESLNFQNFFQLLCITFIFPFV